MIIRQYVNLHVETDVLNLDQTEADDNVWFANEKNLSPRITKKWLMACKFY